MKPIRPAKQMDAASPLEQRWTLSPWRAAACAARHVLRDTTHVSAFKYEALHINTEQLARPCMCSNPHIRLQDLFRCVQTGPTTAFNTAVSGGAIHHTLLRHPDHSTHVISLRCQFLECVMQPLKLAVFHGTAFTAVFAPQQRSYFRETGIAESPLQEQHR